jgi:drug/metabolite transporter (DMT)-like permease
LELTLSHLKAALAVIIWGGSFVATKIVVGQIDPLTLVTVRTFGGALILYLLMRASGQWAGWIRDRVLLAKLAGLAFIGVALHMTIQAVAMTLTTASNTGWMIALSPVFIAVLSWRFLGEHFGRVKVAGLVLALIGGLLVVVSDVGGLDFLALPGTWGDLLAFSGAFTWATYSALSKPIQGTRPPGVLMAHINGLAFLMTLPLFIIRQGWTQFALLDGIGWAALGFVVVFVSALAHLFWYDALSKLEASQVGAFLYVEPLVTVVLSALILSEPIRPLSLVGGAAILAGVWLVTVRGRHGNISYSEDDERITREVIAND